MGDYEDDGEPREAAKVTKVVVTEKRRKKEKPPVDPEGYRFRKYGKKMIGDEARHYYRCTFAGCEAKRHITYQAEGPSIVMIGNHSHPPPARSSSVKQRKKKPARTSPSTVCYGDPKAFGEALQTFEERCNSSEEETVFQISSAIDHS